MESIHEIAQPLRVPTLAGALNDFYTEQGTELTSHIIAGEGVMLLSEVEVLDSDDLKLATAVSTWFDWIPSWLFNYGSFEETENEDLESIGIVAGYNVLIAFFFWLYWTCEWEFHGGVGHLALMSAPQKLTLNMTMYKYIRSPTVCCISPSS